MKQRRAQSALGRWSPIDWLARGHQPAIRRFRPNRGIDTADYGNVSPAVTARTSDTPETVSPTSEQRRMRRWLLAVAVIFGVHGMISGTFATRVPSIASRLHLDAGDLGLALLCSALGSAVIIPLAGKLVNRFGARVVTRTSVMVYSGLLAVPAFMPSPATLCALLLLYGVLAGICDAAMKAQGNSLETGMGRPIMSRLYGMWSLGALAGAGLGTAATFVQLDARLHLAWTAIGLVVVSGIISAGLPRGGAATERPVTPAVRRRLSMPSKAVLAVAVIGFCAAFGEAAAHTWSAVYISEVTGAGASTGSLGFAGFVASMAAGRLAGDTLVGRFGPVRTVQIAGLVAVGGGTLVVTAAVPVTALMGFALLGLGIAVVLPVALSAGAKVAPTPGQGIAVILVAAQLACTAAPATIGGIGELISLPVAFAATVGVIIPIVLLAGMLRRAGAGEPVAAITAAPNPAPAMVPAAVGSVGIASVMPAPIEAVISGPIEAVEAAFDEITAELPAMVRGADPAMNEDEASILVPA